MLYALSWFLVLGLLALWSLAAWAMHVVAVWALSNAGALTGVASDAASGAGGLARLSFLEGQSTENLSLHQ